MTRTNIRSLNESSIGPDVRVVPRTRPNVIILTSGITGSSVLSGFLAHSGYWAGDTTHKKEYDTFENAELIALNLKILQQAGYRRVLRDDLRERERLRDVEDHDVRLDPAFGQRDVREGGERVA